MNKPVKIKTMLVKCNIEMKEKKKASTLQEHIIDEFKGIELDRNDPNLIRYILEKIENEIGNPCEDESRKNMFFDIYMGLFNIKQMNADEKKNIIKVIDFICNEKLIRKVNFTSVMCFYLKKKLL